ncbi:pao retrotransposon peptidase [Loa loa]|uniref:Pao retrotransposon peptidase n=1 Tax=Loa loa TaxID=7209 RepID=A0A1S0TFE8_LOALO|nr:pao retrotransposon peptidase [Loa loa]EFO12899.1 pao retrotransposon peptidase [Loa loa]
MAKLIVYIAFFIYCQAANQNQAPVPRGGGDMQPMQAGVGYPKKTESLETQLLNITWRHDKDIIKVMFRPQKEQENTKRNILRFVTSQYGDGTKINFSKFMEKEKR